MRCSRCGNDNPGDNRFCGMCGATLLPPPAANLVPETQTKRAASAAVVVPVPVATATPPPPEPPAPPAAPPRHEPQISGPSFLGLNDPAPRKRASLSADPHHGGHSGNLDYLLDDEEEPRHSGGGKGIFILVLLVIVVGFGYLRWRNNGFKWTSSESKPPAADQTPTDSNATTPATSSPSVPPEPKPAESQPAAQTPPATTPANPPAAAH